MSAPPQRYVFLGLSITSSWGNGHATTYRALTRELSARGHEVTFFERDLDFYATNRDLPDPPYARVVLYASLEELFDRAAGAVREADLVVVGSYVPEGRAVGEWVLDAAPHRAAFYDIDTPVTLGRVARGDCEYLTRAQIARYALYLSFTGGPTLARLERELGAPCARALYCSVDPELHFPEATETRWDLGYLGTYSPDRQATLERLLLEPARRWKDGRFVVAGAQYPADLPWPSNVEHTVHLPPARHRRFYNAQRWTLNVTRAAMVSAGWSPSVRLFEAAACGTPVVSDAWPGLEDLFAPGREIAVARSTAEALRWVMETPESERRAMGEAARKRVLAEHTATHRAQALERFTRELHEREHRRGRASAHDGGEVNP
jgi:spore maturation protein CgeB